MLRVTGFRRKNATDHVMSYSNVLKLAGCESIETTVRGRRLAWAGNVVRSSDKRLHKRVMFGELEKPRVPVEGGKLRGQEKQWTGCVTDYLKAFGILGDWKAAAQNAAEWKATVDAGRQHFMNAWRKKESAAADARHAKVAPKIPGVTAGQLTAFEAALKDTLLPTRKRRRRHETAKDEAKNEERARVAQHMAHLD